MLQACIFSAAARTFPCRSKTGKCGRVACTGVWPVIRERAVLHRAPHGRLCLPSLPKSTGSA